MRTKFGDHWHQVLRLSGPGSSSEVFRGILYQESTAKYLLQEKTPSNLEQKAAAIELKPQHSGEGREN